MLIHYFKIALRNLSRQKVPAGINILGLSIGLACFCLFLLYTLSEFSYDNFHRNGRNIYSVSEQRDDRPVGDSYLYMPLGPALKRDFPDVVNFARYAGGGSTFARIGGTVTRISLSYVDPQFFSMFSFPLLTNNPATALAGTRSVVLTREKAMQLFGTTAVTGRTIEIKMNNRFEAFTVNGVAEDVPDNSTIRFGILLPFNYLLSTPGGMEGANNWYQTRTLTYVQLKEGSRLAEDQRRLRTFTWKYHPEEKEHAAKGLPQSLFRLHPLQQLHTDISLEGTADPKRIWMLLCIAAGVLLIACINFTTLAIGRSAGRAREVGVKKVMGGGRRQLAFQFLMESLLLSVIAAVLGLWLARLALPYFNQLSGSKLRFSLQAYPQLLWMLAGATLLTGLLAGSYPALVLSGFRPVEVLRRKVRMGGGNLFTQSLVTLQFVFSIGLIIGTVVIVQQLHYMRTKDTGFNKEHVVVVNADGADADRAYTGFRRALADNPAITGITRSDMGLGEGAGFTMYGFDINGEKHHVFQYYAGPDYLRVMGMQLLAGRNFEEGRVADTVSSVIVNEALVKALGWTNHTAIGQQLKGYTGKVAPVVIGVVKDFHFGPLTWNIQPQLFHQFQGQAPDKFFVRLRPGAPVTALAAIERAWKSAVPDLPLQYSFLDQDIDRYYKNEARLSRIIGWAGGVAIFLACMGLFGLAALAAVNRTQEIGIRKVLGASPAGIVRLLSKDFLQLVIIALLIASPLAWYCMHRWLDNFAYRINIRWEVFVITGLIAVLTALATVGAQALKAALVSPARSLRSE